MGIDLRLTARSVEYGAGEITVHAQANEFSGQSSAWFNLDDIARFASDIAAYPLPRENCPRLVGCYWEKGVQGEVLQESLVVAVYPIGLLGVIGVQVKLHPPFWDNDRPGSRFMVHLEIKTTYERLSDFSKDLKRLAKEEEMEAILSS